MTSNDDLYEADRVEGIELEPGESHSGTLEWETTPNDVGEYNVVIESENDYEELLVELTGPAIPDSESLHARYDFSQEDGTMPVSDLSDNGYDLVNGSYSGVTESINGVQAGEFDGVDDSVWSDTVTSPGSLMVFMVLDAPDPFGSEQVWYQGYESDGNYMSSGVQDGWHILSDDHVTGTDNPDVNLLTGVWDDNDGEIILREDGVQTASLSTSIRPHDVITLASENPYQDRYAEGAIGEVLVYPDIDMGRISDVESYLADKWGVSI